MGYGYEETRSPSPVHEPDPTTSAAHYRAPPGRQGSAPPPPEERKKLHIALNHTKKVLKQGMEEGELSEGEHEAFLAAIDVRREALRAGAADTSLAYKDILERVGAMCHARVRHAARAVCRPAALRPPPPARVRPLLLKLLRAPAPHPTPPLADHGAPAGGQQEPQPEQEQEPHALPAPRARAPQHQRRQHQRQRRPWCRAV